MLAPTKHDSIAKLMTAIRPTQREISLSPDEIIVSKTDLKGRILYANSVFCRLAGYGESEVIGQPHSLIRHPDMPRAVFKLLWDTIQDGREIFAYVKNMARNGDHYWVFAHVTPSFDAAGAVSGFHSNRRIADHAVLRTVIEPLYADMLAAERRERNGKDSVRAGSECLTRFIAARKATYDQMVFTL